MILNAKPCKLEGKDGSIRIERNEHGVPVITAETMRDASFAMGWAHANDRQLQMMLTRLLLEGRAAEKLSARREFVESDKYIRSLNLFPDIGDQLKRIEPEVRDSLENYSCGINEYLDSSGLIPEFRIMRYRPEPWTVSDTLNLVKVSSYFGSAEVQGNMEKLIIQMVQNNIDEKKIRELFPALTSEIDTELLKKIKLSPPIIPEAVKWISTIPGFAGSNNWAVSGRLTRNGCPILCGDLHMQVNRIPSVWHEAVIRLPSDTISGFAVPGVPYFILGRNRFVSFAPAASYMDMIDFRIEECRDGKYRRGSRWIPFDVRDEIIKTKRGEEFRISIYENENGILEGDPSTAGFYLVRTWAAQKGCGAQELAVLYNVIKSRTVREAMKHYRNFDAASFNCIIADSTGNIGYQMTGKLFNRPWGSSGLLPVPAWESRYNSRGFAAKTLLPYSYNPAEGYIITANNNLNHLGKSEPVNLSMAAYRAERIELMLKKRKKLDSEYMKEIQYDLYSLQADKLMKIISPLLSMTGNGKILKDWDCCYYADSAGAAIFENVYRSIILTLFGDQCFGRSVVKHLLDETSLFNNYYGNFDSIIFNKKSVWFRFGTRDDILKIAVDEGVKRKFSLYGKKRKIYFRHILFGDRVPSVLGFDAGHVILPGGRATIAQGQIYKGASGVITLAPSCRMIADMSEIELQTNTTCGSADRPYSKWYKNYMKDWINGIYKKLS